MITPSMGIEIELPWRIMLDRVDPTAAEIMRGARGFYTLSETEQARVQDGFDAVDAEYKDLVDSVFGDEIFNGNDGYREFALRPTFEYEPLVETTRRLYDADILREGEEYSLHVTLGNIRHSMSSWLILTCLEWNGGTTPKRIVQTNTWSRKGVAGILERKPEELKLGSTEGFEMRTLSVTSIESLDNSLRTAHRLARLVVSKQAGRRQASERWRDFRETIFAFAESGRIDIAYQWGNPQDDITPWQATADALNNKEWQRNFQSALSELI